MEYITNKIDRESLKPGDHIYAYRKLHSYSHHGIFIGGDRVIHYNKTQEGNTSKRVKQYCKNCGIDENPLRGVVNSCVDCFLKRHTLRRFQYAVGKGRYLLSWPGTCTTDPAEQPGVTIRRANDLFNNKVGFGDYNLFENNCEAFAVFCKTGNRVSHQAYSAKFWTKPSSS
ncbi:putative endopeptidase, NLPC/P60 domain, LRAT-like domain-containing protein [Rosa chinensis]|uniref:Putative endopeptidase, NLPC/P60 domain, LRAT-like domain-containing protein n=1 Tax=Rosa chinensis TaxID=74649 RepID=A0A2P6SPN3_ROSCH|nr:protein LEAD-SENSITIVE 1 [Rosa chinensis]PRQ60649.1 putative endopeptidase, NLPC/P60 domain, LRAT-like domain-containing protein [Rosa chinensis]